MAKKTSQLPAATRRHLFGLVTDTIYRRNASSESYDFVPSTDGGMARTRRRGESLRKFGYTATLPAGTNSRRSGAPDPGRHRLAVFTFPDDSGVDKTQWWQAEHAPGNTYRFHKILVPACLSCRGASNRICTQCGGSGRMPNSVEQLSGPCTACNSAGWSDCAACAPPVVVDGKSVSRTFADWS
ncbi:MAG: hypothetical protein ACLFP0_01715 [Rhodosalinus sp.]